MPTEKTDQKPLFYFSENSGLQENDSNADPVYLEINATGLFNDKIDTLFSKHEKMKSYGMTYRIPEKADLQIIYDSEILMSTTLYIPQFGKISRIPINELKKNTIISFYENYGMLKSIDNL